MPRAREASFTACTSDIVAVVNAWNVFGARAANIFEPLVAALLSATAR